MAEKKQRKALDLYYELLALKEPPMRILFLLVRQYRILFHVQSLQKKDTGKKKLQQKQGCIRLLREIYGADPVF